MITKMLNTNNTYILHFGYILATNSTKYITHQSNRIYEFKIVVKETDAASKGSLSNKENSVQRKKSLLESRNLLLFEPMDTSNSQIG